MNRTAKAHCLPASFAFFRMSKGYVMKQLLAILLWSYANDGFAADNGYNVNYDGGSIPNSKSGNCLKLYIDPNGRFGSRRTRRAVITIRLIDYGISLDQDFTRRSVAYPGWRSLSFGTMPYALS